MKDSLDILLTEPVYVAHDSLDILDPDVICHHGILGMKWGIRRYQNKDGSLTAAGKKRYYVRPDDDGYAGNLLTKKGKKEFQNKDGSWKDTPAAQKAKERHEQNIKIAEQRDANKITKAINVYDELEDKLTKMKGLKPISELTRNDTSSIAEWKHAANLGLRALESTNDLSFRGTEDKGKPFSNQDMAWFLYEDQTIGKPEIAAMINRGYKSEEIKKMINKVNEVSYYDMPEHYDFANSFAFGATEGYNLEKFIDACEKINSK